VLIGRKLPNIVGALRRVRKRRANINRGRGTVHRSISSGALRSATLVVFSRGGSLNTSIRLHPKISVVKGYSYAEVGTRMVLKMSEAARDA
jgi:hypothetical protein